MHFLISKKDIGFSYFMPIKMFTMIKKNNDICVKWREANYPLSKFKENLFFKLIGLPITKNV